MGATGGVWKDSDGMVRVPYLWGAPFPADRCQDFFSLRSCLPPLSAPGPCPSSHGYRTVNEIAREQWSLDAITVQQSPGSVMPGRGLTRMRSLPPKGALRLAQRAIHGFNPLLDSFLGSPAWYWWENWSPQRVARVVATAPPPWHTSGQGGLSKTSARHRRQIRGASSSRERNVTSLPPS